MPIRSFVLRSVAFLAVVLALAPQFSSSASAQGLIRDAELEEMLADYTYPLIDAAPSLERDQVTILIVNNPTINAFVTKGNLMFIHTGLIAQADTPLQVKGVIAHELGHIIGDHVDRIGEVAASQSIPMILGMLLGTAAAATGAGDAGIAIIQGSQHIANRNILKFSRIQESSADQAAITLLTNSKQSAAGLLQITEKLRRSTNLNTYNLDPYILSHPAPSDRVSALRTRTFESPYAEIEDSQKEMAAFKMIQAKLDGFLAKPKHTLNKYKEHDTSKPALYARAIAYYRDTSLDGLRGVHGLDKALELTDRLIAMEPGNPYFHELAGQMLFESGRVEDALPYHRKTVELRPDIALFKVNLGRSLIEADTIAATNEAITVLNAAVKQEPTNTLAWSQLAIGYERNLDTARAKYATAERFYHGNNLGRAMSFAKQAISGLEKGSTEWHRAADIMQIAAAHGAGQENRRR